MKTKTLLLICFTALWAFTIFQVWALGVKPDPDPIPPRPSKAKCSDLISKQEIVDVSFVGVNLRADNASAHLNDYSMYHISFPIRSLNELVTPATEQLDATRRSFIDVSISGTDCSGVVTTRLYKASQVGAWNVNGVNIFDIRGGFINDVKIIANSIVTIFGERLVWTKVYSGSALRALPELAGQASVQPMVKASAVMQYPFRDSTYLHEDSWMTSPVYNDGDFDTGDSGGSSGGGGGVIDPEPYDSLHFR